MERVITTTTEIFTSSTSVSGRGLRHWRQQLGLTQKRLAEAVPAVGQLLDPVRRVAFTLGQVDIRDGLAAPQL
jgi:hypothetical protein